MITFIAEVGVNHEGNLDNAVSLIESAAKNGAQVVKFQSYSASGLAAKNSPSYWDTSKESSTNQHELFSKYDKFDLDDYRFLAETCAKNNVEFLSTCFDVEWVEKLDPLMQRHKVASADLTNFQLLAKLAQTKKPLLLSTGAAKMDEISETLEFLSEQKAKDVTLLHCVLNYPTETKNASLLRLMKLSQNFPDFDLGYSDHTTPSPDDLVLLASISLGVKVIEKHFTFDKTLPGNDHYHAFDGEDLARFMARVHELESALAYNDSTFLLLQEDARKFARRGIYAKNTILEGSIIAEGDLIPLRPGGEISATEFFNLVGRRVQKEIVEGQQITWSDLN
jgi:N-acetylneuraminate synthase